MPRVDYYRKQGELLGYLKETISSQAETGMFRKVQRLIAESRTDSNANTSALLLNILKLCFSFFYKRRDDRKFVSGKTILVKTSMVGRTKRNNIPMSKGRILRTWDNMSPINGSFFSANKTKWSSIFSSPLRNIVLCFVSISAYPVSFAFLNGSRICFSPFLLILIYFLSVFRTISFLPYVVFSFIIALSTNAKSLMRNIISFTRSATVKVMFLRPHSYNVTQLVLDVNR